MIVALLVESFFFFFSSRRRHTRFRNVTGVQTCALPICRACSSLSTSADLFAQRRQGLGPFDQLVEQRGGALLVEFVRRENAVLQLLKHVRQPDVLRDRHHLEGGDGRLDGVGGAAAAGNPAIDRKSVV